MSFTKPYVILWKTHDGLAAYHGLMNSFDYKDLHEKSFDIIGVPVSSQTMTPAELLKHLNKSYGLVFKIDPSGSLRNKYVLAWREIESNFHGESDSVFSAQVSLTERELHEVGEALLGARNIVDVVAVPHDEPPMSEEDLHEAIRQEYGVTYEAKLGPKDWIPKWRERSAPGP